MMAENSVLTHPQRNNEKDALFPTSRDRDLTTDDVIIRGEDAYNPEQHEVATTPEQQVQSLFHDYQIEFNQLIDIKVRNELVKQIFVAYHDKDMPAGSVNLQEVADVINKQIQFETDRHFTYATYLSHEVIPSARMRHSYTDARGTGTVYAEEDVPILESREEAHLAMVEFLAKLQKNGEDATTELAEATIKRLLPHAREEVVTILKEQKRHLEEAKRKAAEKIVELEQTIEGLTYELSERDMQLLDYEMVSHLTEEAKSLAR